MICHNCKKEIHLGAKFCNHCGMDIKKSEQEEVRYFYRKLAHKFHPDKTNGNEEMMKKINKAYADGDLETLRTLDQDRSVENIKEPVFENQMTDRTEIKQDTTRMGWLEGVINGFIVVVGLIGLVLIFVSFITKPYGNDSVETDKPKTESLADIDLNNESVPKKIIPPEVDKCANMNEVSFLETNYKLYDLYNLDSDIKVNSNEMKVYGILKNNSSLCSAKDIIIKVSLGKRGEEAIQEKILHLFNINISPNKNKDFSEIFKVYESLLYVSLTNRTLKPGINVSISIVSVNEPIPKAEKNTSGFQGLKESFKEE